MASERTDWELLRDYGETRSEQAFGELVRRHADLVHSAALRQTRNPNLAEDVTQAVFLTLARKARTLSSAVVVPGWLVLAVRREAAGLLRKHARRADRERLATDMNSTPNALDAAWDRIAPLLDEGLAALRETDRNAVVLHYLQHRTFSEVGTALGVSEEAARKRVSRALDALRDFFGARKVAFPSATVGSVLLAFAVQPAPPALAAGVASTVAAANVTSAGVFSEIVTRTLEVMAWTKTKTIVAAAVVAAAIPISLQWQENRELRRQVRTLESTLAQQTAPVPGGTNARAALRADASGTPRDPVAGVPPTAPLSSREIMRQAMELTARGKSPEDAVKDIEPLLAKIPVADIKEAADQALAMKERNWRMGFLHMLLRRWARTDGAAAANYFAQNVKGDAQLPLLAGVLPAWAEYDAEGAWKWFQTTARTELNFDARGGHNSALKEMFVAMGRNDFERSLARTQELSGIDVSNAFLGLAEGSQTLDQRLRLIAQADAIGDTKLRADTRKSILSVWAGRYPGEAQVYVERLPDPALRSEAAGQMGPGLMAGLEPEKAAAWWLSQTTEGDRPAALSSIMHRWTEIDLVGAGDWLGKQGNGPEVDGAKRTFATQAMLRAPQAAIEWANTITDAQQRMRTMQAVHRLWRNQDAAQAQAWLGGSGLSAEDRQALETGK
jgi:RNA polymerase sigma factor (sigma-70 family)